jgi:hypothetical protein
MCIGPGIIAAVSIATSVLGTVANYSEQQAQASYANSVAQAQFKQQQSLFQQSQNAYEQQLSLNAEAAGRAYTQEQQKLSASNQKAADEAQQLLVKQFQSQGSILASGRSGQSIGLMVADTQREYGRDLANLGLNLGYANMDYGTSVEGARNQWMSANNLAASNRMIEPTAPLATPGPSALGLVTGFGNAAMGGLSTYKQFGGKIGKA